MKNKILKTPLTILFALSFALAASACVSLHTHDYDEWVTINPPTCTEQGLKVRICKVDGTHNEMEYIPPLGHDWQWVETTPPDDWIGGEETKTCSRCGEADGTRPGASALATQGLFFTSINDDTAYSVSLGTAMAKNIIIPATHQDKPVTVIGGDAFSGFENLESITIPASVTRINDWAFSFCTNLKSVTFAEDSRLESIGGAFLECTSLESITIPASVKFIYGYTFSGCTNLTSVIFAGGSKLETVGDGVFAECISLKSIIIPAGVSTIGNCSFRNCFSLKSVIFAEGSLLEIIGGDAFVDCVGLESIIIPAGVTRIGGNMSYSFYDYTSNNGWPSYCGAFRNCASLVNVYYGGADSAAWEKISIMETDNEPLINATLYYYSETPAYDNHWRFVDGVPTIWLYDK